MARVLAPSEPVELETPEPVVMKPSPAASEKAAGEKPAPGEVVSLDSFRKK